MIDPPTDMNDADAPLTAGVLGGSFDPVHEGHLHLARAARDAAGLDRVLFVPAATSPHKRSGPVADEADRVAMLEIALRDEPDFSVSLVEIERGGVSYTVETLEALSRRMPETELRLLMGADVLKDLHRWKRVRDVLRLGRPLVAARPGAALDADGVRAALDPSLADAADDLAASFIPVEPLDVSSTAVRERVRDGQPVADLLPAGVAEYIHAHRLYSIS